ncbi:MAG: aldehyde dehydrogenase family protein [Melioribacteraceae bacterium]|nr:aldehyde dehydrogenase family protein [Melioribacteraceae bacterium]
MNHFQEIDKVFLLQKKNKLNINSSSAGIRKEKLSRLLDAVIINQSELIEAVSNDLSRSEIETKIIEIFPLVSEIRHIKRNLSRWMRPKYAFPPLTLLGTSGMIEFAPKGQVLIISPWNYPILLTLAPLAMAIAAGNCVMLKPSEFCPGISEVVRRIITEIFDEDEISVIISEADTGSYLVSLPYDHIYFTGSSKVGKQIAKSAAENFASTTLELGGKSPVIIGSDSDLEDAASKIVWGKFINCGQTCIAPDYVLIPSNKEREFIELVKKKIEKYYGSISEISSNSDYGRIINDRHKERLTNLLENALAKGGINEIPFNSVIEDKFISPVVISNVNLEMEIMKEEIFGPILPVINYNSFEEIIEIINQTGNPLTAYIFSHDSDFIRRLKQHFTAGSFAVNNVVIQYANYKLPFGGVKQSGLGKSHGFYGFKSFSNELSTLKQLTPSSAKLLYPPYSKVKQKLIDFMIKHL